MNSHLGLLKEEIVCRSVHLSIASSNSTHKRFPSSVTKERFLSWRGGNQSAEEKNSINCTQVSTFTRLLSDTHSITSKFVFREKEDGKFNLSDDETFFTNFKCHHIRQMFSQHTNTHTWKSPFALFNIFFYQVDLVNLMPYSLEARVTSIEQSRGEEEVA